MQILVFRYRRYIVVSYTMLFSARDEYNPRFSRTLIGKHANLNVTHASYFVHTARPGFFDSFKCTELLE